MRREHFNKMRKSDCNVKNLNNETLEPKKNISERIFYLWKTSWMPDTMKSFHLLQHSCASNYPIRIIRRIHICSAMHDLKNH